MDMNEKKLWYMAYVTVMYQNVSNAMDPMYDYVFDMCDCIWNSIDEESQHEINSMEDWW